MLMAMAGCFITGTDTGVGKTHVATALIRRLRSRGIPVRVRKPVESGCVLADDRLIPEDARLLNEAAGSPECLQQVCPFRFSAPLSPERAARLANRPLSLKQLVTASQVEDGFVVVEGAGGFYSPIATRSLNADLAQALGLPIVLVAEDRLGILNQVLLVVEAAKHRRLCLLAIIVNQTNGRTPTSGMDNPGELRRWLQVPVLSFPYVEEINGPEIENCLAPLLASLLKATDR